MPEDTKKPLQWLPPLPLFILKPLFAHLMASLIKRHPELFDRLDIYKTSRFLINPVDLPFSLLLAPNPDAPELVPFNDSDNPEHDASISADISRLVDLVNGEEDGDALFFSRDIKIEGDTEAVLALRNAVDDMEIDLVEEIDELLGPFAGASKMARAGAQEAGQAMHGLKTVLSEVFVQATIDRSKGNGGTR